MQYLMCLVPTGSGYRREYHQVTPDTERKISGLYQQKRLPATFRLNQETIVTDTILGFTDNPIPDTKPSSEQKFKSWDDFRAHVEKQAWYLRAKSKHGVQRTVPTSPSPIQSLL